MPLTDSLQHHHKDCDEIFAAAEEAILNSRWEEGERLHQRFLALMEMHFGTEEQVLFPAFEAATGMSTGPTQVMRIEHAQMRDLFDQMSAALMSRDADAYAGVAGTLLILMQQHNLKEENILYPMCDRTLAAQEPGLADVLQLRLAA